eukprot:GEMP01020062.1.p1 GENE.GEMP01020062.1~~GEMP01020062.1.p1  ORF type:complete len:689 (+),score=154.77 GEMP01020062.1:179-2245(+)
MFSCDHDGECIVEVYIFAIPSYVFLLLLAPLRAFDVYVLARSSPPARVPTILVLKRLLTISTGAGYLLVALMYAAEWEKVYVLVIGVVRSMAWVVAFFIMALEYKRYQPQTWIGVRGFWCLAFIESVCRLAVFSSPLFHPIYGGSAGFHICCICVASAFASVHLMLVILTLTSPYDLSIDFYAHAQALMQQHRTDIYGRRSVNIAPQQDSSPVNSGREGHHRTNSPTLSTYVRNIMLVGEGRGTHCEYKIEITTTQKNGDSLKPGDKTEFRWSVRRRYRDFEAMHSKLRRTFTPPAHPELAARIPQIPPNNPLAIQNDAFLETRRRGLDGYVSALALVPEFLSTECVLDFLDVTNERGRQHFLTSSRAAHNRFGLSALLQTSPTHRGGHGPVLSPPEGDLWSAKDSVKVPKMVKVSIPCYELKRDGDKKHVEYRVHVSTTNGTWEVSKRYRDFEKYDLILKQEIQCSLPFTLPPKMHSVMLRDYYFHQQRRIGLETYLQSQCNDAACSRAVTFAEFLEIEQVKVMVPASLTNRPFVPRKEDLITYHCAMPLWCAETEGRREYVRYAVVFYKQLNGQYASAWQVFRRYRQFAALSTALQRESRGIELIPPIPPKSIRALSDEEKNRRKNELEKWLNVVLIHFRAWLNAESRCHIQELVSFLGEGTPEAVDVPAQNFVRNSSSGSLSDVH